MAYAIQPTHHGLYAVTDEAGEVATFRLDTLDDAWVVTADPERFRAVEDLPAVFGGRCNVHLPRRCDVHRMFGVALPGSCLGASAVLAAEAA